MHHEVENSEIANIEECISSHISVRHLKKLKNYIEVKILFYINSNTDCLNYSKI